MSVLPEGFGPPSRAGEVLAAVHRRPGLSRSELATELGLSSGLASDLVARLVGERMLAEGDAAPAGRRGRPTRTLWPHPQGPLVIVAAISHEDWRVEALELGGGVVGESGARHDRDEHGVLQAVGEAVATLWSSHGPRVRGLAASAPGTVSGTRLIQAPNLGWRDVALEVLRPAQASGVPMIACNDATYSAIGELARGVAAGHASSLHLVMDSGIGGALVDGGRVTTGVHGMAGEFGHMPFGPRDALCRCGARGCWNTEIDGVALARTLGRPVPDDEVSFSRRVLAEAVAGDGAARAAAGGAAASLGRGAAGLVNATDPDLVVLSGLAADILAAAPEPLHEAFSAGLMETLADRPPALVAGALGDRGTILGAMEAAFAPVLAHPF
jgi:predicted NBD/HSP70 family sugar kinase